VKVDDNLNPQRRFPPPITRLLLVRYPLATLEENPKALIAKDLEAYFLAALKESFPLLWESHREFAERLLPDNVDYDDSEAVLLIRHPRRESQMLQLDRPHDEQRVARKERA
jgi:hypothetical protein